MYKTQIETRTIGNFQVKLNRVTNVDELYDQLIQQGPDSEDVIDERIPYWTELWASAIAMGEFLSETEWINDKTLVHEIGCGLALPAIVSGMMGGKVMVSDYLDQPLQVAKDNLKLNGLEDIQIQKLDWRAIDATIPRCDLLLAADVAYEKRMFNPLLNVFHQLVKPEGIIIFSEPQRKHTQPFYDLLREENFFITTFPRQVPMNNFNQGVNVNVIRKVNKA